MLVRPLDKGMGEAVARRTVFRPSDQDSWANVARRVALGNTLLGHPQTMQVEAELMTEAIASGSLLMSGRHLQHGDEQQSGRAIEVFTNCSSAAASFAKFYLLLNGSGVGRSYDDHMMVVNWQNGPNIRLGLSSDHVDFPKTPQALQDLAMSWGMDQSSVDSFAVSLNVNHLTVLNAISRGIEEDDDFVYLQVEDSREGWAHALERWETMAFLKDRRTLIIDWTPVRYKGAPIGGMQDRPASGPLSPMRAFWRVFNQVVLAPPMALWRQAMVVDHFMSEEVQVGGARRAARMSTKDWHDSDIIDFIEIKSKGGLWTSNNSITVDAEFWKLVAEGDARAKEIFDAATACSFINGEPGFINGDLLEAHGERQVYDDGSDFRSDRFQAKFGQSLLKALGERAQTCRFQYITNPCVTGDAVVLTDEGERPVSALIGKPFTAIVNGEKYQSLSGFWKTGTHQVYRIVTDRGSVRATANHRFKIHSGSWIETKDLVLGDQVVLANSEGCATVMTVEADGIEDVYDCTIEGIHAFSANGLMAHNCGEIVLHVLGAYCVIADVAPVFAFPGSLEEAIAVRQAMNLGLDDEQTHAKLREWDDNFHKAAKIATRALMRVNKMPALYQKEVERTQRIGVGLTGVHEYAWLRFGLTFDDMLSDKPEAAQFWAMLKHVSDSIKAESIVYAKELGVDPPHTVTTMKPSGTTSKLFGLTEGAHLPSMASYLRWVQFQGRKTETGEWAKASDPQLPAFEAKGYPMRQLKEYAGTTIVGFPTIPLISRLGMPKVVTAPEATPDQQYQYLRLLEQNWIGKQRGNQVSYTLKIFTDKVSLEEYRDIVLRNQPTIRCCSVMPTKPDSQMGYEYLPEQAVTLEEMAAIVANIKDDDLKQDIDINTLLCSSGACPI